MGLEAGDERRRPDQVADADPGQRPELGQAPDDHDPGLPGKALLLAGNELDERFVDDDEPAGMPEAAEQLGRLEASTRILRIADDDEVGVVGDGVRVELPAPGVAEDAHDGGAGGSQRSFRLAEARMHGRRARRPESRGEQPERLAGAVQGQDLLGPPAVAGGGGLARSALSG